MANINGLLWDAVEWDSDHHFTARTEFKSWVEKPVTGTPDTDFFYYYKYQNADVFQAPAYNELGNIDSAETLANAIETIKYNNHNRWLTSSLYDVPVNEQQITPDIGIFKTVRDNMYYQGQLQRVDIGPQDSAAKPYIDEVISIFPEYDSDFFLARESNFMGIAQGYRQPYTGRHVSWYNFAELDSVTAAYFPDSASQVLNIHNSGPISNHYGLKFNLDNGTKILKAATVNNGGIIPELPENAHVTHISRSWDVNGELPQADAYFISYTEQPVRDFCEEHGFTWPVPSDITARPWLYSALYDRTDPDLTVLGIKAYISKKNL